MENFIFCAVCGSKEGQMISKKMQSFMLKFPKQFKAYIKSQNTRKSNDGPLKEGKHC